MIYFSKNQQLLRFPKQFFYCLDDYRPVALTSVAMKTLESFVFTYLKSLLSATFVPFQFAYRANRSSADAISVWLHKILAHLGKKGSYATALFIDYNSAFNTIIPAKLHNKLLTDLKFPITICDWILDFLLCRKQTDKVGSFTSRSKILNTGSRQGCVLSPLLYSLFTHDCTANIPNSILIKFADDITVIGLIINDDESHYRNEIELLVNDNNNILNIDKTKELIVDFRKCINMKDSIIINGSAVEQVSIHKFHVLTVMNTLS